MIHSNIIKTEITVCQTKQNCINIHNQLLAPSGSQFPTPSTSHIGTSSLPAAADESFRMNSTPSYPPKQSPWHSSPYLKPPPRGQWATQAPSYTRSPVEDTIDNPFGVSSPPTSAWKQAPSHSSQSLKPPPQGQLVELVSQVPSVDNALGISSLYQSPRQQPLQNSSPCPKPPPRGQSAPQEPTSMGDPFLGHQ